MFGLKILLLLIISFQFLQALVDVCDKENFEKDCPHKAFATYFVKYALNDNYTLLCKGLNNSQCPSTNQICLQSSRLKEPFTTFMIYFRAIEYICTNGKAGFLAYQGCLSSFAFYIELTNTCPIKTSTCEEIKDLFKCVITLANNHCKSGKFVEDISNFIIEAESVNSPCGIESTSKRTYTIKQLSDSEINSSSIGHDVTIATRSETFPANGITASQANHVNAVAQFAHIAILTYFFLSIIDCVQCSTCAVSQL